MNVLEIPFNKFLGMQKADPQSDYILKLEERNEYLNHLGTLHAACLFSLAEASSGEYLLDLFKEYDLDYIPVLRKSEIKYSNPGNGTVFSKAELIGSDTTEILDVLNSKKRVIIKVKVDVFNEDSKKLMTSVFDWFVVLR